MSALDAVAKFFKPESVKAFREALAAKGIPFATKEVAKVLEKSNVPPSLFQGSFVHTTLGQIGVTVGPKGSHTVCSQLVPLANFPTGAKGTEAITEKLTSLLRDWAVMSNPSLAKSIKQAPEKASKLPLAA